MTVIAQDDHLTAWAPFANFIYKTHFIIGICLVNALNLKKLFDVNSCGSKSCFTIEISLESVGRFA